MKQQKNIQITVPVMFARCATKKTSLEKCLGKFFIQMKDEIVVCEIFNNYGDMIAGKVSDIVLMTKMDMQNLLNGEIICKYDIESVGRDGIKTVTQLLQIFCPCPVDINLLGLSSFFHGRFPGYDDDDDPAC